MDSSKLHWRILKHTGRDGLDVSKVLNKNFAEPGVAMGGSSQDTNPNRELKSKGRRRVNSGYLRIIGIALFIWIIVSIDQHQLMAIVLEADVPLLLLALFLQFLVYTAKTLRWHVMVRATNLQPTFGDSWRLYNIGVFLATITPAKLGELGKAAYLKKEGLPAVAGIALVFVDRLSDVLVISLLSIAGVGILFGPLWSLLAGTFFVSFCLVALFGWKCLPQERKTVMTPHLPRKKTVFLALLFTVISWILYFAWTLSLAESIALVAPLPALISALTITGILSLLPIAPAGLGTRDAALLTLLATYGVSSSQSVALALLMFCSIVVMGIPGGLCWIIQGKKKDGQDSTLS
tara:strand:+ start:548 stop:1594 length:1047 start_codon:yes stop_codon:yes gene_type:complete